MSEQIILSVKFKYKPNPAIDKLLDDFKDMVNFCIKKALETKSTSLNKLHHAVYRELTSKYDYNTQYTISAIRVALAVLKAARRKGVEPQIRRRFIRFSPLLTKFDGSSVRISVRPREFITIPLEVKEYHEKFIGEWKRGVLKLGEIILNDYVIIPFKKEVDLTESHNKIALDVNEKSLVGLSSDGVQIHANLSEIKRLHDTYFEKRRGIQSKLAHKSSLMKRILAKYKARERNRVKDVLHKVSKKIAELAKGYAIIMENLTNIRRNINYGRKLNRRLHSWNFRKLQFFIEYKAKLNGSKVFYVNPKNTSKVCSRCGGVIAPMEKMCKCGMDRHINACINMLKKQDDGREGSPDGPLMKLLKSGTGKVGRLISLSNLSTA
jgi:putative transposase